MSTKLSSCAKWHPDSEGEVVKYTYMEHGYRVTRRRCLMCDRIRRAAYTRPERYPTVYRLNWKPPEMLE